MPPPRRCGRFAVWALVPVLVAACGDRGGSQTGGDGTTTTAASARPDFLAAEVQVRAEDIRFSQSAYTATAGDVGFGYVNDGEIRHTLVLERSGKVVDDFQPLDVRDHGDLAVGAARLTAGDYVLYCDIAGHRQAGMEATLTVAP